MLLVRQSASVKKKKKKNGVLSVSELDGSYPAYGYADLPLDTLPLDPDLHETYIPDMTYDPRQAYPEPL